MRVSFPSCITLLFMVIGCPANPVPPPHEIHKGFGVEDLRRVFQVESHDEVPTYEVIHARSLHKRSIEDSDCHHVHIKAFGKTMQLDLRKNNDLLKHSNQLKMFYADTSDSGAVQYKPVSKNENPWIGEVYQDLDHEAALIVDRDPKDGSLMLDGTIGDRLVIKPVPVHLKKEASQLANPVPSSQAPDDEFFLDDEDEDIRDDLISLNGFPLRSNLTRRKRDVSPLHGAHIVYKRTVLSSVADTAEMEVDEIPLPSSSSDDETVSRQKRSAPPIIYPEILVIVDYDGYRLHNGNNRDVKKYFVSFWNGVDLRYKLLNRPRVKVSIAGIIISRGRDATPYLERNKVGRDAIDSASALTDMGKYLYVERRLPTYDVAVAITKLDMCRRQFGAGICNRGTAGFAYVGGACVVNKRLQKVNSVAIVEDTGGFSGIIVAAHEVGHLLGAVHDGSPPPSYLGGPGAVKCRWEDGYIMSDLRHTDKGFKWSPCSIDQFHHFLNGETATCLFNVPHEDDSLPRVLPGKLLSLDAQCRKDRGTSACFKDDRVCAQLFCFDAKSGYCVSYRPAAEGSPCGDSQVCLNGRCIYEHENIIPDYTRITETVERLDTASSNRWNSWTKGTTPLHKTTTQRTTTTTESTEKPVVSTTRRVAWWKNWFSRTTRPAKLPVTSRKTTTTTATTTVSTTTTTTTTTTPRTTSNIPSTLKPTTKISRKSEKYTEKDKEKGFECLDRITNIAGSLTCKEFLRNYGFRYCHHRYIQKNCCASQKLMCNGR